MITDGKIEFYKNIFEKLPESVVIADFNDIIIDCNQAFEVLSGINKESLLGKTLTELIISDPANCSTPINNNTAVDKPFSQRAELNAAESKIPVRIVYNKSDDICIILISALSELGCVDQAHVDFVSTVSHELRTPLTSIKGFADTLLTSGDLIDAEKQKRFITIIKSQVDRLTRLVENLLTVSRLESRRIKSIYKAVPLKILVDNVLRTLAHKAKDHKIILNIPANLPPVWADSDKLEQVLTNLIDNAVKYSYPETCIIISAKTNDNDKIEISVEDEGIGISKEHIDNIFTKFSRIDNPLTRQAEGTGLGLYITKSLVDGMGGEISLESSNKGSVFTVKLSVATPEKHAAEKFLGGE